jgi:hypothetical protein
VEFLFKTRTTPDVDERPYSCSSPIYSAFRDSSTPTDIARMETKNCYANLHLVKPDKLKDAASNLYTGRKFAELEADIPVSVCTAS